MIDAVGLLADTDGRGHMGDWDGGWMWLWAVVMMALFVVLVVWVVRTIVGPTGTGKTAPRDPADRAREILAERYAKGEISTDEYRERFDELT